MRNRSLIWFSLRCIGLMLLCSLWAYATLPHAAVALRWTTANAPVDYAPELVGLLVLPAVALAATVLLAGLPLAMPRRDLFSLSKVPYAVTWRSTLLALCAGHMLLLAKAAGATFGIVRPITALIAIVMLFLGNYMGKIRYNYAFGIRTPWTLANPRVWDRAHRFGGRCMVVAACVLLLGVMLAPDDTGGGELLGRTLVFCAVAPSIATLIFSAVVSRRLERSSREAQAQ